MLLVTIQAKALDIAKCFDKPHFKVKSKMSFENKSKFFKCTLHFIKINVKIHLKYITCMTFIKVINM